MTLISTGRMPGNGRTCEYGQSQSSTSKTLPNTAPSSALLTFDGLISTCQKVMNDTSKTTPVVIRGPVALAVNAWWQAFGRSTKDRAKKITEARNTTHSIPSRESSRRLSCQTATAESMTIATEAITRPAVLQQGERQKANTAMVRKRAETKMAKKRRTDPA